MNIKKSLVAAMAVALIGVMQSAGAGTSISSFNVNITIAAACTVTVPGGDITFLTPPNGNPSGETGITTINAKCTNTTPYVINLTSGSTMTTTGTGNMIGSIALNTDTVAYALFTNPAHTFVWGNGGVPGTPANGQAFVGNGAAAGQNFQVNAIITGSLPTFPTPDTYSDIVDVNLVF